MKSIVVHLMNKYYGHDVSFSGERIAVKDSKTGELLVCLLRDAHGQYVDRQDLGARDAYCLSPIPKDARAYKLYKDNKIGKSEEFEARSKVAKSYVEKFGYVPCIDDCEKDPEKYSLKNDSQSLPQ